MKSSLRYRDEIDRAHGAVGAVIGICAFDGENYLVSVNLDANPGEMMDLLEDFYLPAGHVLSVSRAWRHLVSNYRLAVAMCAGDLLCRRLVGDKVYIKTDERDALKEAVLDPAEEFALEPREASILFDNCFNHLEQLFESPIVARSVSHLVQDLCRARSLTRYEILDHLRGLM